MLAQPVHRTLHFSGYEWEIRQTVGNPRGSRNLYNPANAWVDKRGFLHLRIAKNAAGWTSAEVDLSRSLGYGSYRFIVHDVSQLEPAAVLNISSWDDSGPYREMDIETSRWGEPTGKNALVTVRLAPEPPKMILPLGTSVGFEEVPLRVKLPGAVWASPTVRANGPTAVSSLVV